MSKRYLDDFVPGETIMLGQRTLSRDEIVAFATDFDPQPFHIDEKAAQGTIYGGLIASGWHTVAVLMRMLVDGLLSQSASLGSPGVDKLRWLKPVRPNDTLTARGKVRTVRLSRSKPDRGIVEITYEVINQNNDLVLTMDALGMFARRTGA